MTEDTHNCPKCSGAVAAGDINSWERVGEEIPCPHCGVMLVIEGDDSWDGEAEISFFWLGVL